MTFKLNFDKEEETCTGIVMYPSKPAHDVLSHFNARGIPCRLSYRGEDQGATITLSNVPWRLAIEVFEEFLGRELPLDKRRKSPPDSVRVPARRSG